MFHVPALFSRAPLLRRWAFSAFRRYVEWVKPRYSIERRLGVWMLLDKVNKVDLHLLCAGVWEPDRLACLEALAKLHDPGGRKVFLDIGAHGGLYALALDRRLGFQRLLAFEPEPASLAQIRANAMMNGMGARMQILPVAVSDREGEARFLIWDDGNRGQSRLAQPSAPEGQNVIRVPVTTVDRVFDEKGVFVVAKIDVEGLENQVVAGMAETLRDNFALLQIEKNGDDLAALEALLLSAGMRRVHSIGQDHYFVTTAAP